MGKLAFYNFESGAFNHSATLPLMYYQRLMIECKEVSRPSDTVCVNTSEAEKDSAWQKTPYANLVRYKSSGIYFARFRVGGKLIRRAPKTSRIPVAKIAPGRLGKSRVASSARRVQRGDHSTM